MCWRRDSITCAILIGLTTYNRKATIIYRRATNITASSSDTLFTCLTLYCTDSISIRFFTYSISTFEITSCTTHSRCLNIGTSRSCVTSPSIFRSSQKSTARSCISSIFCNRKRSISICPTSRITTSSSDTFFTSLTRRNICKRIVINTSNGTIIWYCSCCSCTSILIFRTHHLCSI